MFQDTSDHSVEYINLCCIIGSFLSKIPPENEFTGHNSPVYCGYCSKDSQYIVTVSKQGIVKVWSFASGECLKTFYGSTIVDGINYYCFVSPKNDYIVLADMETRRITIWSFEPEECILSLDVSSPMHVSGLDTCLFVDEYIWYVQVGDEICQRSLPSAQLVQTINTDQTVPGTNRTSILWTFAVTPDQQHLVVVTLFFEPKPTSYQINVWSVKTGKQIRELLKETWSTPFGVSVSTSSDGTRAVARTSMVNSTYRVFDIFTGEQLSRFNAARLTTNLDLTISRDFRYCVTIEDDKFVVRSLKDGKVVSQFDLQRNKNSAYSFFSYKNDYLLYSIRNIGQYKLCICNFDEGVLTTNV